MSDNNPQILIEIAAKAKEKAYAPYSEFKVGASLFTTGGNIYSGCNIENASYGLSVCAERVALFKALSEGEREFLAIAIVGDNKEFCYPCGACRQVLAEFSPELEIITGQPEGKIKKHKLSELLPENFRLK